MHPFTKVKDQILSFFAKMKGSINLIADVLYLELVWGMTISCF